MNESRGLLINGQEATLPASTSGQKLSQWVETLRTQHAERDEILTELAIDGVSFASDDPQLALIPVESARLIEVFTRPKNEVALETLEGLIPFLEETAQVSERLPNQVDARGRAQCLRQLCEGLELLTDALETSKRALNLRTQEIMTPDGESVAVIEADLLSILQDWADCQERGDRAYEKELLETHLPKNLRTWADSAIPALLR